MEFFNFNTKTLKSKEMLSIQDFIDLPLGKLEVLSAETRQYILNDLITKTNIAANNIFQPTFLLQNLAYDSEITDIDLKLYILNVLKDIIIDFEYNINLFEKITNHVIPKYIEINDSENNISQNDFYLLDTNKQKQTIEDKRNLSFLYLSNLSRLIFYMHNIYLSDKFDKNTKQSVYDALVSCLNEIKPKINKLKWIEKDTKK